MGETTHSEAEFFMCLNELTHAITETVDNRVLKLRPVPIQKCWWSRELVDRCREVCRVACKAYNRRLDLEDLDHCTHRMARGAYAVMIENSKRVYWESFLSSVDKRLVWRAHHYMSNDPMDGGMTQIHNLKMGVGPATAQMAKKNEDKSCLLHATFFPTLTGSNPKFSGYDYYPPKFKFDPITDMKFMWKYPSWDPTKPLGQTGSLTSCSSNAQT